MSRSVTLRELTAVSCVDHYLLSNSHSAADRPSSSDVCTYMRLFARSPPHYPRLLTLLEDDQFTVLPDLRWTVTRLLSRNLPSGTQQECRARHLLLGLSKPLAKYEALSKYPKNNSIVGLLRLAHNRMDAEAICPTPEQARQLVETQPQFVLDEINSWMETVLGESAPPHLVSVEFGREVPHLPYLPYDFVERVFEYVKWRGPIEPPKVDLMATIHYLLNVNKHNGQPVKALSAVDVMEILRTVPRFISSNTCFLKMLQLTLESLSACSDTNHAVVPPACERVRAIAAEMKPLFDNFFEEERAKVRQALVFETAEALVQQPVEASIEAPVEWPVKASTEAPVEAPLQAPVEAPVQPPPETKASNEARVATIRLW